MQRLPPAAAARHCSARSASSRSSRRLGDGVASDMVATGCFTRRRSIRGPRDAMGSAGDEEGQKVWLRGCETTRIDSGIEVRPHCGLAGLPARPRACPPTCLPAHVPAPPACLPAHVPAQSTSPIHNFCHPTLISGPASELGADLRLLVAAPAAGDVDNVAARQQQHPRCVVAALAHLRRGRRQEGHKRPARRASWLWSSGPCNGQPASACSARAPSLDHLAVDVDLLALGQLAHALAHLGEGDVDGAGRRAPAAAAE
jgi:hypothetical protein